jgi:hypothetical protein
MYERVEFEDASQSVWGPDRPSPVKDLILVEPERTLFQVDFNAEG